MAEILITGGAGFIGSFLTRRYLDRGDNVHVIVRPHSSIERLPENCSHLFIHRIDLADRCAVDICLGEVRPERVFHLAAETRPPVDENVVEAARIAETDVLNLLTLLSSLAATKTPPKAFIRAGSMAEYGSALVPYLETARERPVSSYGAAMLSGTQHLHSLRDRLPFPVVTARLSLIYGPTQSTQFLIPLMIERCMKGQPITIQNPGDRRDLMYVDDVIDAIESLSDAMPLAMDVINLCTGIAPTMTEVASLVVKETGASPSLIQYGVANVRSSVAHLCGSPDLADVTLNWRASISLAEGIRRSVSLISTAQKH